MKKWVVLGLFSILVCCPAVSGAAGYVPDSGKGYFLSYPLINVPLGGGGSSVKASGGKKKQEGITSLEAKQKKALDKKVDDAIKKAWGKQ